MTTAPTPSEQVWQLSCALEIAAALPDMPQVTIPRIDALEAAAALQRLERENDSLRTERHDALCKVEVMEPELARLQAENERLQSSLDAQRLISDRAIALAKELEARKPLPLSYRAGAMTSSVDGGATVSLHFNDMAEAEAWFVAITDQHDAGLVDKTVKLQDRQRFWGFFHSTCIYESDAELISLHATKAGAWRAMHRAQWLAWEEVRTLQMAGRREPGWKAYVHEASHIGLVEVQP